jgi:hypothetical protein
VIWEIYETPPTPRDGFHVLPAGQRASFLRIHRFRSSQTRRDAS